MRIHYKYILCLPTRKPFGRLKREWGANPRTQRCCKYRDSVRVGASRSLGKPEKAAAAIAGDTSQKNCRISYLRAEVVIVRVSIRREKTFAAVRISERELLTAFFVLLVSD